MAAVVFTPFSRANRAFLWDALQQLLVMMSDSAASHPNAPTRLSASLQGAVAHFSDDYTAGSAVMESWLSDLAAAGVALVDGVRGCDAALAVKDAAALAEVAKAGALTARVARQSFVKAMEAVIENEEAGVTNASLSARVVESIDDLGKLGIKVDTDNFDFLLQPTVQSGGKYSTFLARHDAKSSGDAFRADVVTYSAAMKYNAHAAFLARTFFIDPSPSQARAYDAALAAQAVLIEHLRPGKSIKDAANAAVAVLLAANFGADAKVPANFGSGFGLRANDRYLAITPKNETVIEAGMVFNAFVRISDIPLSDALPRSAAAEGGLTKYCIAVGDTVVVEAAGAAASRVVTDKLSSERSTVVYSTLEDDEEEAADLSEDDGKGKGKSKGGKRSAAAGAGHDDGVPGVRSTRLASRKAETEVDEERARRRKEHQVSLLQKATEAARKRLAGGDAGPARSETDEIERAPGA